MPACPSPNHPVFSGNLPLSRSGSEVSTLQTEQAESQGGQGQIYTTQEETVIENPSFPLSLSSGDKNGGVGPLKPPNI